MKISRIMIRRITVLPKIHSVEFPFLPKICSGEWHYLSNFHLTIKLWAFWNFKVDAFLPFFSIKCDYTDPEFDGPGNLTNQKFDESLIWRIVIRQIFKAPTNPSNPNQVVLPDKQIRVIQMKKFKMKKYLLKTRIWVCLRIPKITLPSTKQVANGRASLTKNHPIYFLNFDLYFFLCK